MSLTNGDSPSKIIVFLLDLKQKKNRKIKNDRNRKQQRRNSKRRCKFPCCELKHSVAFDHDFLQTKVSSNTNVFTFSVKAPAAFLEFISYLFKLRVHLVRLITSQFCFALFSSLIYVLSAGVLTRWVAPPKMFGSFTVSGQRIVKYSIKIVSI